MPTFIDRRLDGKHKSAVNRQRFIRRFKSQLKKAVNEAMNGRSIKDMDSGEKVSIPARDISEPVFGHGPGGHREIIHPGNKEFVTGDRVPRPKGGRQQGVCDRGSRPPSQRRQGRWQRRWPSQQQWIGRRRFCLSALT
jgi:uncharacterized sporulation protein YeaH/YhbH (DUF444 family)